MCVEIFCHLCFSCSVYIKKLVYFLGKRTELCSTPLNVYASLISKIILDKYSNTSLKWQSISQINHWHTEAATTLAHIIKDTLNGTQSKQNKMQKQKVYKTYAHSGHSNTPLKTHGWKTPGIHCQSAAVQLLEHLLVTAHHCSIDSVKTLAHCHKRKL